MRPTKSNSNGYVLFVEQNMEFANSQMKMAKLKRVHLQLFPIILLQKNRIMDPLIAMLFFLHAAASSRGFYFSSPVRLVTGDCI